VGQDSTEQYSTFNNVDRRPDCAVVYGSLMVALVFVDGRASTLYGASHEHC